MSEVANPAVPWLLEYGGFAVLLVVLAKVLGHTVRARKLTVPVLMFIGGFSIWWQEWWLDWAYYLRWSPEFDVVLGGDWTGWTTPVKP